MSSWKTSPQLYHKIPPESQPRLPIKKAYIAFMAIPIEWVHGDYFVRAKRRRLLAMVRAGTSSDCPYSLCMPCRCSYSRCENKFRRASRLTGGCASAPSLRVLRLPAWTTCLSQPWLGAEGDIESSLVRRSTIPHFGGKVWLFPHDKDLSIPLDFRF